MSLRTISEMTSEGYRGYFAREKNEYIGWAYDEYQKGWNTAQADALAVKSHAGVEWLAAQLRKHGASEAVVKKTREDLSDRLKS